MNAPFDHVRPETGPFDDALAGANRWRGECIQQFAELELIIADALDCIAAAKPMMKIKRNEQIRPAFNELKRVIGTKGALARNYGLTKSLMEIDKLIDRRAYLTHGVLGVWRGKSAKWLLTLQHREPGHGPVRWHAFPREEAERVLRELTEEVDRLGKRVRSMREALAPEAA